MKLLPLSGKNGKGKFCKVNDDVFEWAQHYKWYLASGYPATGETIHGAQIYLHQCVKLCYTREIDHKDRDRLNALRSNLRWVSRAQNKWNCPKRTDRKYVSQYKGIWFWKTRNLWSARIMANGKRYFGGYYVREEDAAAAWNELALKHHGKYAILNEV